MARFLNLGCGSIFLETPQWKNFDFSSGSPSVIKGNLLRRLPFDDNSNRLVYSSHVLEHIPRPMVLGFLKECYRVLESGGFIRLVLPDLENMAREYLRMRSDEKHDNANFVVLELVDQCIRREPGGEMARFYKALKMANDDFAIQMTAYVRERVGENLREHPESYDLGGRGLTYQIRRIAASLPGRLRSFWIRIILRALPSAFREQNVSLASVGERHHWLWDFSQIRASLESAGFSQVTRQAADRSSVVGFPFFPLDLDSEGRARKGSSSMYIEAVKD